MNIKKILSLSTIVPFTGILFTTGQTFAGETHTSSSSFSGNSTPTKYIIRISAIEFHRVGDSATTYQPFVTNTADWDIASANPGGALGTMNATTQLPAGTYDKIRFTVSKTMTVQGSISALSDGSPCRTQSSVQTVSNPFGAGVIDTAYLGSRDGGTAEPEAITVPSGSSAEPPSDFTDLGSSFRGALTLPQTFTITTGSTPTIKIKFDVTNAAQFVLLPDGTNRCVVFPGPPSMAINIT